MPTVPTLQVLPSGGGAPRLVNTIGNEAERAGQRVSIAGQQLIEQGNKVQDAIDEARTMEADVQVSKAITGILSDPDSGYLATRGGNAVDQADAVREQLQKAIEDAGGGLKSPRQQAMFRRVAEARFQSAVQRVDAHAMQQAEQYKADMLAARAETFVQEAAANPFDDKLIASRKGSLVQTIAQVAVTRGWSPEQTQLETLKATTALHGSVLQSMIGQEKGDAARAYLAAHIDEIAPDKRDAFEKTIKTVGIKSDSLKMSLMIDDEGGSLAEKRTKLRKMFDAGQIGADLFDATDQRLRDAEGLRQNQRQEQQRAVMGQAQEWFLKHPGASPLSMPAPLYAAMKEMGQLDAAKAMSSWGGSDGPGVGRSDPETVAELLAAAQADPEGFATSYDPRDYASKLTPSMIDKLWGKGRNGGRGEGGGSLKDYKRGVDMISAALAATGIDLSPKPGSADARATADFQIGFMTAIEDATRANGGKPLSDKDLRELGLSMVKDVVLRGIYTDKGVAKTGSDSGPRAVLMRRTYEEIPPVIREQIRRDLLSAPAQGLFSAVTGAPTKEQVVQEYRRRVLGAR